MAIGKSILFQLLKSLLLFGLAQSLSPIEIRGQDFVDSATGKRFEIIGVDYQPGGEGGFVPSSGEDPLSDRDTCIRDAALMQSVGFNTIRCYNVNPDINHDECASIFNAVGIYMVIDVNSPLQGGSIDRYSPQSSYTLEYLKRTFKVIDAFSGYPNTLGFFSANEIINDWPTASKDPPYIRAVTRDLKQYIAAQSARSLAVGYSAADFRDALVDTSQYLQCFISGDPDSRSDFFALNSYSWCGRDATFESSTYDQLAADFADTSIPVFFSEYGCIDPSPRYFTEVPVLYGPRMTMWSGGLVYEWTEEGSGYGLVQIMNDGSVQIINDLDFLESQYRKVDLSLIQSQNATARSLKAPICGPGLIQQARFSQSFTLPVAPEGTEQLIKNGAGGQSGSLVPVTKTAVQVVVTQVDGSTSRGLTITLATGVNKPQPTTATSINSPNTSPVSSKSIPHPTTKTTTSRTKPTSSNSGQGVTNDGGSSSSQKGHTQSDSESSTSNLALSRLWIGFSAFFSIIGLLV